MAVFKNQVPQILENLTICSANFILVNSRMLLDRIKTKRNIQTQQL